MRIGLLLVAALAGQALSAQRLKIPPKIEALNQVASEVVDVTLDSSMLRFAERFLSDKDQDQSKAKRLIRGLNNIYIKTFEFDREGAYSEADLQEIRMQLRSPEWSRMVEVRSRRDGENVDIFMRMVSGEVTGVVILAAERRELSIIEIDGPIRPEDIASLSGHVGLPTFGLAFPKGRER